MLIRVLALLALVGALAVAPAAPGRAQAPSTPVTTLRTGPVTPFTGAAGLPVGAAPTDPADPCVLSPSAFPRRSSDRDPADWCISVGLDAAEAAPWALDVELPLGAELQLAGRAPCSTAAVRCASGQLGTLLLVGDTALGSVTLPGRIFAAEGSGLVAQLELGRGEVLAVPVGAAREPVAGRWLLRLGPLPAALPSESGGMPLRLRFAGLRLWGAARGAAGATPLLAPAGCDGGQLTTLTVRAETTTRVAALADLHVLRRCQDRTTVDGASRSSFAGSSALPAVPLLFATQATKRRATRLGALRAVIARDLPAGAELVVRCRRSCRGDRIARASVDLSGSATARLRPALRVTRATRVSIELRDPLRGTTRRDVRFARLRDATVRAIITAQDPS